MNSNMMSPRSQLDRVLITVLVQLTEKRRNGFWNRRKCFRMKVVPTVAQLGEHLLCKHAFISPKSLHSAKPSANWATDWATEK